MGKAIELLNKKQQIIYAIENWFSDYDDLPNTVIKALEVLDKVEQGGDGYLIEYCQGSPNEVAKFISDKYILIERGSHE